MGGGGGGGGGGAGLENFNWTLLSQGASPDCVAVPKVKVKTFA